MSGETSPQRREPGAPTVLGAVAALLAATACFVGCATEVSALGSGHSTPAAILIGAAAAFAVGAVVLVRVAIRLEHRFRTACRRPHSLARTAGPRPHSRPGRPYKRPGRPGGRRRPGGAVRRGPGARAASAQ